MTDLQWQTREDGTRIAFRHRPGRHAGAATLVFLPGYMSDMTGGKATTLDTWAGERGHAMLRLDYGGCGASEGAFEDQTLDDWLGDVLMLLDRRIEGQAVLAGSSMGGWLMLLAALARPDKVRGLVGIAAAPDFTQWGFDEADRRILNDLGRLEEKSDYGEAPYVTTRAFWESGQRSLLLDDIIGFDGPVRLLHGQADADVPHEISLAIARQLRSSDVQTLLIKDGDHRLSRDADIALLIRTVADLMDMP